MTHSWRRWHVSLVVLSAVLTSTFAMADGSLSIDLLSNASGESDYALEPGTADFTTKHGTVTLTGLSDVTNAMIESPPPKAAI